LFVDTCDSVCVTPSDRTIYFFEEEAIDWKHITTTIQTKAKTQHQTQIRIQILASHSASFMSRPISSHPRHQPFLLSNLPSVCIACLTEFFLS
jgi:hypothetical protein